MDGEYQFITSPFFLNMDCSLGLGSRGFQLLKIKTQKSGKSGMNLSISKTREWDLCISTTTQLRLT